MKLHGLHHITMITGDAQRNVDFYADLLGLRLVKKTVNFDAPDAYHLYFGDEQGSPGTLLTWFEFRDAARGRAGSGMVHLIQLGVRGEDSLSFWEERLRGRGESVRREPGSLRFADYDGLGFELVAAPSDTSQLPAHPEIPPEHAIARIVGARAYASSTLLAPSERLLTESLGFASDDAGYTLAEGERGFRWAYDEPPAQAGFQGAGTVHHIAWACGDEDQREWRERLAAAGAHVTPVIDRDYFFSIYFREPSHVLFEIATPSPGFAVDEDPAHLGEGLRLPAQHEHLRAQLERVLTPVSNPRTRHPTAGAQ
jgi:glyoxalase family protein